MATYLAVAYSTPYSMSAVRYHIHHHQSSSHHKNHQLP
jgi:hypothetical protein